MSLADFAVLSSSSYNANNGVITFVVKNIGTKVSTGWSNNDYRRVFEVTTNINESQAVENMEANSAMYVSWNNTVTTYYPKNQSNYAIKIKQHHANGSTTYNINSNFGYYLVNTPLHQINDVITIQFTGNFLPGKTYVVAADDAPYYGWPSVGDTTELIDDSTNPSNNFFIFTVPTTSLPICFPGNTPVLLDQGIMPINKIDSDIHTIRNKKIVSVIISNPKQKHIVCIKKDALNNNIPSIDTYISQNHEVLYNNQMTKSKDLVNVLENVIFVDYDGQPLYNVLMENHNVMMVNNLIVETMNPNNIMSKLETKNISVTRKNEIINYINECVDTDNRENFFKITRYVDFII